MTVSLFVRFFLCRSLVFSPVLLMLLVFSSASANDDELYYYELARYHAPVIYQQTDAEHPNSNYITSFDFDGDFVGDNNWDNTNVFEQPAYVYYSVFDTTKFYYIFYGVFHPRRYNSRCLSFISPCHENDFSGAMVVVRKTNEPYGTIDLVETFVNNNFYTHQPSMTTHYSRSVHANSRPRLALWSQARGHNLYVLNESRYQVNHLCGGGNLSVSQEDNQAMENIEHSEAGHIKYVPSDMDVVEVPGEGMTEGTVRYQLLNMKSEFFDKIEHAMEYHSFYRKTRKYQGTRFGIEYPLVPDNFHGSKYQNNQASFPWAWFDGSCTRVKRGDWFFDPAYAVNTHLRRPINDVDDYIYNPYLGIYPADYPTTTQVASQSPGNNR